MKAGIYSVYGDPSVLAIQNIAKPIPKKNEVLIRVRATSINSSDWELLNGKPLLSRLWGFFKPKFKILGSDVSGIIEEIGENVTAFKKGDRVFGDLFLQWGGFAEYVCAPENLIYSIPDDMTFEEIAALPQAGVVALQGIEYNGSISKNQKVLINGAGGGAGTYAIQIAKAAGAHVTGIDSKIKLDLMREVGADCVIDYATEDFAQMNVQYDLIFDIVGSRKLSTFKKVLAPKGAYVLAGGPTRRVLSALILKPIIKLLSGKKMGLLMHQQNKKDIDRMIALWKAKKVKPVIDQKFPLSQLAEAFRYFGNGLALGKIVVVNDP